MTITIKTIDFQRAADELRQALKKWTPRQTVTVGIHEDAGMVESGDITMAQLGATHEFGAKIDHPGGTSYGYATAKDAEDGRVKFLKTGQGYMELGVTGPHVIEIPARPWLIPGVQQATPVILETISDGIAAGHTPDQTLEQVGIRAVGEVQQYMTDLKTPPNAASTAAKKGSDNPLIHNGHLRGSVTHQVTSEIPTEGL